ncbi:MAG: long-chain fatty acid--CoA ligase, partial [Proteobacteria bacterium]|nr:long-chain fatty acid--CoA ligase [Pseudomonadota bacterium]
DGWLHSGDLGRMDEDGFLFITGRKKDIIITSGAKNISPAPIEAALMSCPLIEHAVVVGDGKKYLTALLTVCMEGGGAYAQQIVAKVDGYQDLIQLDGLERKIADHVEEVNVKLARVEQIKTFTILKRPLTEDDGEITSLQKIKRFKVIQKHAEEIDAMY